MLIMLFQIAWTTGKYVVKKRSSESESLHNNHDEALTNDLDYWKNRNKRNGCGKHRANRYRSRLPGLLEKDSRFYYL